MAVNRDKVDRWKADIAQSVDLYNDWFMKYAPETFKKTRVASTADVAKALKDSDNLRRLKAGFLRQHPSLLPILRMCTCPPIARDRLIGLAHANKNLVKVMEDDGILPRRMKEPQLQVELEKIANIISRLLDEEIFGWLKEGRQATAKEIYRASTIVADRRCSSISDPLVRNEQERRQLDTLRNWLRPRGYIELPPGHGCTVETLEPGQFCTHLPVPGLLADDEGKVKISVDAVVMRKKSGKRGMPLLIEAKSAGDFTNVNKRRKEEGLKHTQLKKKYGPAVEYILLLCGYFDTGYLGYSAAEGIDWVWEHRLDELAKFGV